MPINDRKSIIQFEIDGLSIAVGGNPDSLNSTGLYRINVITLFAPCLDIDAGMKMTGAIFAK